MKRTIVLSILIGVQVSLEIRGAESNVKYNLSKINKTSRLKALIDTWMNQIVCLSNENKNLEAQLRGHQRFYSYVKQLIHSQKNEVSKLKAQLQDRDRLIKYQRHTIQELSEQAIENPYFP